MGACYRNGNVMIMGTLIAGTEWKQAWSRIPAIAAFIAAVWCPRFSNLASLPGGQKEKSLSLSFSFSSGAADLRCEGPVSAECERTCSDRRGGLALADFRFDGLNR